ncbi:MAG: hypothetical protein JRN15_13885 [Nitrososphaerota archaeon]|nr:hypothetical protein [Nitrososphaerota archaeon]
MKFEIAFLLCMGMFTGNALSQQSVGRTAKDAFIRYLYDSINSPIYELPKESPIPIGIKIEKNKVYVSMPNVLDVQSLTKERFNWFFTGLLTRRDSDVVILYDAGLGTSYSNGPLFNKLIKPFETGGVITDTIRIPTNWKPIFDTLTPPKEQMLKGIVSSLKKQIRSDLSYFESSKPLPRKLKLIIYNFNIDSWHTYALLEPSHGLWYTIELHDIDNNYVDEYKENGEYGCITGDLKTIPGGYKSRILKYGIVEEVDLRR